MTGYSLRTLVVGIKVLHHIEEKSERIWTWTIRLPTNRTVIKTHSVSYFIYFQEKKRLTDMSREISAKKIKKCIHLVGSFTVSAQGA